MEVNNKYIRFDWAVKRMLRDKANFAVLEGLITVLLGEQITISEILESEGNQNQFASASSRICTKALDSNKEPIYVEIRIIREYAFRVRSLKLYSNPEIQDLPSSPLSSTYKKAYSIGIAYFSLGCGLDFFYRGTKEFYGVNTKDILTLTNNESREINLFVPENINMEHLIIRVPNFTNAINSTVDEWVNYLKNNIIPDTASAPGLEFVRRNLLYWKLNESARLEYDRFVDEIMQENDAIATAKMTGWERGYKSGLAQSDARKMKELGIATDIIQKVTGLSPDEIASL